MDNKTHRLLVKSAMKSLSGPLLILFLLFLIIIGYSQSLIVKQITLLKREVVNIKQVIPASELMRVYINSASERISSLNNRSKEEADRIAITIWNVCAKFNLDPYWFEALGQHESWNWKHRKGLTSSDYGFWMVNVDTFDWLKWHPDLRHWNAQDPSELEKNDIMAAEFAAVYLSRQIQRFGDYNLAILAYHKGPGLIQKDTDFTKFEYFRSVKEIHTSYVLE